MNNHLSQPLANPAPLGLMGFGMTTLLFNISNAGFFPVSAMLMTMGIFYGGLAQIIAGMLEFRRGNTFGVMAFISYGLFWWTLIGLMMFPRLGWADPTPDGFMGCYSVAWGLMSLGFLICALKMDKLTRFVFTMVVVLYSLLALQSFTGSELIGRLAGWDGIVVGLSAMYQATALVVNEVWGREVLPMGSAPAENKIALKAA
ncbi:acetate uptake transporter [Pelagibaculum spongiae]|nr:acetate uptake transporter [Pelagibaculum spongiae]